MCKLMEDYGNEKVRETLYQMVEKKKISIRDCAEELHMSEFALLEDMGKEGYKVPSLN